MSDNLPTQPPRLSVAYSATAELTVELAKMLTLVAPTSMTTEQQEIWLRAAVDALKDIRPSEVVAISDELRRSVTRPNQIVPEISRLVAAKRARAQRSSQALSPWFAEREITLKANAMRAPVKNETDPHRRKRLSDAFEWERAERIKHGLPVPEYPKPLSKSEIASMPAHIKSFGLKSGFLVKRNGEIVEAEMPA